jgi:hypothetical protein
MQRLNIGLALSGLAAVAAGTLGGWALVDGLALQASARTPVEIASIAATSPTDPTRPNPVPAPAPSRAVEAPPPAPPAAAPDAPAANAEAGKPHIHLDGERSALSYEGESGSLYINKDRMSVRTPFGKFDIDW